MMNKVVNIDGFTNNEAEKINEKKNVNDKDIKLLGKIANSITFPITTRKCDISVESLNI